VPVTDPDIAHLPLPVRLRTIADPVGIRRIHVLAWRELADPEAGGSELHAHEVMRRWAAAGLDVTIRTSEALGLPHLDQRDGYRIVRRGGRYDVFPRAAFSAAVGQMGARDGLVEIWNGVPFLSPLWARCPRVVILHHVHGPMWKMALGDTLGTAGEVMERRLAPLLYRRTRILTLSSSSRDELVHELGLRPELVRVIPPGIDERFGPGGEKDAAPLVVAVGRLAPVKRFDALIRSVAAIRPRHPGLRVVIAGEGTERQVLESEITRLGADDWISLPGRVSDDDIVDLYRRAWVVASSSAVEGWGMTLTEAAACGTPAVATRTTGHLDAVVDGTTGVLADDDDALSDALHALLTDHPRRRAMADAALVWSARFSWDATSEAVLAELADDARSRGVRRSA
jgi:glycosyltransferase involved in cell wall biosynthesis